MSSSSYNTIVHFYDSERVFVTGATGMFGTAYISWLVQSTTVSRVYALARGGE
jgi:thioester reductase-like protein